MLNTRTRLPTANRAMEINAECKRKQIGVRLACYQGMCMVCQLLDIYLSNNIVNAHYKCKMLFICLFCSLLFHDLLHFNRVDIASFILRLHWRHNCYFVCFLRFIKIRTYEKKSLGRRKWFNFSLFFLCVACIIRFWVDWAHSRPQS